MPDGFEIIGQNAPALFTLKVLRGEGMSLLSMNWKTGKPPDNFVGFAIEYKEPGGAKYYALQNRLCFPGQGGAVNPNRLSTLLSPIQKFRWVHFPRNADLPGLFSYKVTPVFMDAKDKLSYGDIQTADVELSRETYPGKLNVAFTRGFVSSQSFVEIYKDVKGLLPSNANSGLKFTSKNPQATDAYNWMGFEARQAILGVLDQAIADGAAQVRVVAYDFNEPEIYSRLLKLGSRVRVIIDNSSSHGKKGSAENQGDQGLTKAGIQVKRQHMGSLQHNKFIAVDSTNLHLAVCGSTNFSWRAFFVQNNNAVVLNGKSAVQPFLNAFDNYWASDAVATFGKTGSAVWTPLGLSGIDAKVAFSPHSAKNALLKSVADDVANATTSSLFYSLAFLYETPGVVKNAIVKVTKNSNLFVYGISDKKVGGIVVQKPDGNLAPLFPVALTKNLPQPFKAEPTGGGGTRMHHKFLVVDFDKPTARVYVGSYNFSVPADTKNGENLLVIRDRRVAVSYLVEALSMLDHYHFRVAQLEAKKARKKLQLAKPPRKPGETPWWTEYYTDKRKIRDRELFA